MGKRILNVIFAFAVFATVVLVIAIVASMLEPGTDPDLDKFAQAFALPYGLIVGTVFLTVECELYCSLKYFLFDKERRAAWRSVINGINLVLTSAFALFSLVDVLFLTEGYFAMQIGILVVPAVLFLRMVYWVISQLKG
ncbi:MAG: hypothetical protein IJ386_00995 [Clostridia bacterium]|nr:hypothetical protein [Clostridia bacterium]